MNQTLRDKIPPVYFPFFEPVLPLEFPEETIATCDNCTRCRSPQSPFLDTKCCDYHPHLANFLVGGIFSDTSWDFSFGQARLREKIRSRHGVTPYGIIPPDDYSKRRKALYQKEEGFYHTAREEAASLLCPYYNAGSCSIWKYRENLCVTYFCSSVAGKPGQVFWKKVNKYLALAERELSKYAMCKLGWPPEMLHTESMWSKWIAIENDSGDIAEEQYAALWLEWAGREEAFYIAAFEVINSLGREDFCRITGQDHEILEAALVNTQKVFMRSVIPDYLVLHPNVEFVTKDKNCVKLVSGQAEVETHTLLLPLLKAFNGKRRTVEVFDMSFRVLLNLSGILQELLDKQILIPAEADPKTSDL